MCGSFSFFSKSSIRAGRSRFNARSMSLRSKSLTNFTSTCKKECRRVQCRAEGRLSLHLLLLCFQKHGGTDFPNQKILHLEHLELPKSPARVFEAPGEPIFLCTASSASKDRMAPVTAATTAKTHLLTSNGPESSFRLKGCFSRIPRFSSSCQRRLIMAYPCP